jgi:hypothetical protein
MRIQFFSPHGNVGDLDRNSLVNALGKLITNTKLDEIYFVTCYSPDHPAKNHYLLSERETLRMKVCCRLLKIIDRVRWIPTFLSIFPLLLGKTRILETFLGCDPDVIISFGLRWDRYLKSFLKRYRPAWLYLTKGDHEPDVLPNWRCYDKSAKVSIVLPTYNGSQYIHKSIKSCLRQTHDNIELIIVDDGSTEDIEGIVRSYADSRIKFCRHEVNLGLPKALNTGFRESTGTYLTWTSDDNYYATSAIEEMARFLQTYPELHFVYTEYWVIDEHDIVQRIEKTYTPYYLKFGNFIGPCFLYKREVYETIGEYNQKVSLAEDYDYWLRVSQQFKMQAMFRQLYFYRYHRDSLTSKYGKGAVLEKVGLAKKSNKVTDS